MLDYLTALEMVNMCSEMIKFWDWCHLLSMFWHINQLYVLKRVRGHIFYLECLTI